jgi:hypothetical protein
MRERLISLIKDSLFRHIDKSCNLAENIADDLLENGVVALPCKVGDVVYFIGGIRNSLVKSAIVEEIIINDSGVRDLLVTSDNCVTFEKAIDAFYFTREEAERALKGGEE